MSDPRATANSYTAALKARDATVEQALIRRIEQIEGRVPSDAEVNRHGHRFVYLQSGREEYRWRGVLICAIETDWQVERVSFKVTS